MNRFLGYPSPPAVVFSCAPQRCLQERAGAFFLTYALLFYGVILSLRPFACRLLSNFHLSERTLEITKEKQETLWSDVSALINFSMFIIYLAIGLVIAAFIYLAYIDSQKAIKSLIGLGIFTFFILAVYLFSFNVSDQELFDYNSKLLSIKVVKSDIVMAKMAISSTIILIFIAVLGWVGSPFFKYLRK